MSLQGVLANSRPTAQTQPASATRVKLSILPFDPQILESVNPWLSFPAALKCGSVRRRTIAWASFLHKGDGARHRRQRSTGIACRYDAKRKHKAGKGEKGKEEKKDLPVLLCIGSLEWDGRRSAMAVRWGIGSMGGTVAKVEVDIVIIIFVLFSAVHMRVLSVVSSCRLTRRIVIVFISRLFDGFSERSGGLRLSGGLGRWRCFGGFVVIIPARPSAMGP